jgi:hypothetical protein
MRAHHAGNGIAVAESNAIEANMGGLQHELLGVRGAAQRRKIRRDGEFKIPHHAYVPCRNQRGGGNVIS